MNVTRPGCGHGLWAEEVPVADRFGVWACFDDEENSDTYAERVGRCPGCGAWVNAEELLVTYERRGRGSVGPSLRISQREP
jgi:hypothetical protein